MHLENAAQNVEFQTYRRQLSCKENQQKRPTWKVISLILLFGFARQCSCTQAPKIFWILSFYFLFGSFNFSQFQIVIHVQWDNISNLITHQILFSQEERNTISNSFPANSRHSDLLKMAGWMRWHCPPDTGFEIRPSSLPLGHGGSPQYYFFTSDQGRSLLFL